MFNKVLVANRGEIALRVIRACKELGIGTVAVYSTVDRASPHVRFADEAYCIGPASAADSYLRGDVIIDVAKRARAEAIHPGYGFLAENADFAEAVAQAGLVFIGPPPAAMRVMGNKNSARLAMAAEGIPVVPGSNPLRDAEDAKAAAWEIGYPVVLKASAGGGGKGMREVRLPEEIPAAFRAAQHEAAAAFGDGTLYLERLIEQARHIEFQVLADSYGNTIHLGERECSLQRRYQKLIEEAPSVVLDDKLRQEMGSLAVRAARSVGYSSAGTVEFLVDQSGDYFFLEMNPRLQVEHPVTELVTGVDLVREQVRIASGRKLGYRQEDVPLKGWAIECRISAEDPYNDFMPSIGKVTAVYEPAGAGVRLETGVYAGFEVSLYYDPLIAKLAVWGETRGEAILRMRRALQEYRILGIKTNIPLHLKVMDSTSFIAGKFNTQFIEDRFVLNPQESRERWRAAAVAATLLAHQHRLASLDAIGAAERVSSPWRDHGRRSALQ
ncbi:MAG: acetyl-CoA carboxylase biotin carboxylase subunit [Chloroflexota bacterium]|nr:acetyl-CoA carboxylase biotin carboxylase subunit [Chloroflexota bacterium]